MIKKVIIIAEAGINHNGKLSNAKKLIDVASNAGADYVKFQTYITKNLVSENTRKAKYQTRSKLDLETQFAMLKKLELSKKNHFELISYSKKKNIKFLSSAFDIESINFLASLKLDYFKIPSGEINNVPYLRKIGRYNKPTILSTGMSNIKDIKFAINILMSSGLKKKKITVLQCNSDYPSNLVDSNINAMNTIKKEVGTEVGFSDHTIGMESSAAATALGAKILEKHITLDKSLEGPDHSASLAPHEFKNYVSFIRNILKALGSKNKKVTKSEKKNIKFVRKRIFSSKKIFEGDLFTEKNLTTIRSEKGISAKYWDDYIGKKSKCNYEKLEEIE